MIVYNIDKNTSEIYLGNVAISEVYICSEKVFPSEEPPTPVFGEKYKFTLNDSSIVSAECDSSSAITTAETKNYIYNDKLVTAEIGDCVTSIEASAFQYCYALTNLKLSNNLKSIENQLCVYCSSLTSIDIPDSVADIGQSAFEYCSGLTSVTIGSGVIYVQADAFRNCKSLTSVTFLGVTPPKLMGTYVFYSTNNCPIYVPQESVNAYKTASGWSKYADRIQPIQT